MRTLALLSGEAGLHQEALMTDFFRTTGRLEFTIVTSPAAIMILAWIVLRLGGLLN